MVLRTQEYVFLTKKCRWRTMSPSILSYVSKMNRYTFLYETLGGE